MLRGPSNHGHTGIEDEDSTCRFSDVAMDQYRLIPFLVGWTSIYQLFWFSPGVQGFDTLPCQAHVTSTPTRPKFVGVLPESWWIWRTSPSAGNWGLAKPCQAISKRIPFFGMGGWIDIYSHNSIIYIYTIIIIIIVMIILFYIILYYIVYYIILYYILSYIIYHIILYYIVFYIILYYIFLSYYIILYFILYYIILYFIILYYIILYYILYYNIFYIIYYLILYYIILYYIILNHIMLYYIMLYHIISYYIMYTWPVHQWVRGS